MVLAEAHVVHVLQEVADLVQVVQRLCPSCAETHDLMVEHVPWFGLRLVCLGCGEEWQDGERSPRPFRRNWRAERIAAARQRIAQWKRDNARG